MRIFLISEVFCDGTFTGRGTLIHHNGSSYDGEFLNNSMHGHGIFKLDNGYQYEGEFYNGEQTGHGTAILPGGNKYVGEFKSGRPHGKGILFTNEGIKVTGEWFEGEVLNYEEEKVDHSIIIEKGSREEEKHIAWANELMEAILANPYRKTSEFNTDYAYCLSVF